MGLPFLNPPCTMNHYREINRTKMDTSFTNSTLYKAQPEDKMAPVLHSNHHYSHCKKCTQKNNQSHNGAPIPRSKKLYTKCLPVNQNHQSHTVKSATQTKPEPKWVSAPVSPIPHYEACNRSKMASVLPVRGAAWRCRACSGSAPSASSAASSSAPR